MRIYGSKRAGWCVCAGVSMAPAAGVHSQFFYLSSVHLEHARQKHLLDFVTQQGVLDGV